MDTLGQKVSAAAMGALGAPEHLQIAGLIRNATAHVVDRDAAEAVHDALENHTWTVESNLDLIPVPSGATWYEWPLPTRSGRGGGDAARTGCLVVPHPEVDNLITIVTAWESQGLPMHAYGIAVVDLGEVEVAAIAARRLYSKVREESLTRIMSHVGAFVPDSFRDEMLILTGGDETSAEAAMRDATAEVPFLLALMLAIKANGGIEVEVTDGYRRAYLPPARRRDGCRGIIDGILKRRHGGFVRTGEREATWLRA